MELLEISAETSRFQDSLPAAGFLGFDMTWSPATPEFCRFFQEMAGGCGRDLKTWRWTMSQDVHLVGGLVAIFLIFPEILGF